jgi:hypothetical protein
MTPNVLWCGSKFEVMIGNPKILSRQIIPLSKIKVEDNDISLRKKLLILKNLSIGNRKLE